MDLTIVRYYLEFIPPNHPLLQCHESVVVLLGWDKVLPSSFPYNWMPLEASFHKVPQMVQMFYLE